MKPIEQGVLNITTPETETVSIPQAPSHPASQEDSSFEPIAF